MRQSTGKRLRFDVFKRDGFTCMYCGKQPPEAVLVVDHIHPVVAGGATTIDNLITACEPCNQGKAGKVLTERAVRPDADLLYLETQQEIAELLRYQGVVAEKETVLGRIVEQLQDLWITCSGLDWAPADSIVRSLVDRHGPEIAEAAVRDVAPKEASGYLRRRGGWVPYLHVVARNMAETRSAASEPSPASDFTEEDLDLLNDMEAEFHRDQRGLLKQIRAAMDMFWRETNTTGEYFTWLQEMIETGGELHRILVLERYGLSDEEISARLKAWNSWKSPP